MELESVFDVEVISNGEAVFGYYADNTALLSSDEALRLQVLRHLEAAADYIRKTLSPATESRVEER